MAGRGRDGCEKGKFHSPSEIDVLEEPNQSLGLEVVVELVDVEFLPQSPFVGARCQWWHIPHQKVVSPARVQLQEGLDVGCSYGALWAYHDSRLLSPQIGIAPIIQKNS